MVSIRVILRAGVEGSVAGAGSPSGPRASSAVWLRLRSGWVGCWRVVGFGGASVEASGEDGDVCDGADGAVAGAGSAVEFPAGVKRPAPAPVSAEGEFKSFISTALLWFAAEESRSSLAEAPGTACPSTGAGGFATTALCSSVFDAMFPEILLHAPMLGGFLPLGGQKCWCRVQRFRRRGAASYYPRMYQYPGLGGAVVIRDWKSCIEACSCDGEFEMLRGMDKVEDAGFPRREGSR